MKLKSSHALSLLLVLVLLTGCRPGTPPTVREPSIAARPIATPLVRTGDEIVVCGQYFHTGTPVVLGPTPAGTTRIGSSGDSCRTRSPGSGRRCARWNSFPGPIRNSRSPRGGLDCAALCSRRNKPSKFAAAVGRWNCCSRRSINLRICHRLPGLLGRGPAHEPAAGHLVADGPHGVDEEVGACPGGQAGAVVPGVGDVLLDRVDHQPGPGVGRGPQVGHEGGDVGCRRRTRPCSWRWWPSSRGCSWRSRPVVSSPARWAACMIRTHVPPSVAQKMLSAPAWRAWVTSAV